MKVYSALDLETKKSEIIERLRAGEVGALPTDTIYGLTTDAANFSSVERVLAIKGRVTPVSCIPHDLEWARELVAEDFQAAFTKRMPEYLGSYTTLWPANKKEQILSPFVQTEALVGIRFPEHWIRELAREAKLTFTTTSVNRTGQPPVRSLSELPEDLAEELDFFVDQGVLEGRPSTLVRCDSEDFSEQER